MSEVFVSHGRVTHPLGAKCRFCEKVQKEYEKALKDGTIDKILKDIAYSSSGRTSFSESDERGSNP